MVQINREQLERRLYSDSFYDFVRGFWATLIPDEKPIWNWHIEFLCKQLQRAAERVFENKPRESDYIINVPPGTTKSTICSIMFPAWVLSRMPSARIICASHTETLVHDLSTKSRYLVESEKFKSLYPHINLREDQNTKGYWMTGQGGFRMGATVGGKNPTGFHAHFLIVDDPIDPQKVFSQAELKQANDFMNLTIANRKVDQRVSVTILIMQRLHQDDPTGNRLENKKMGKVRHVCLPAEVSDNVKPGYLKSRYVDGLLDPIRLPRRTLAEKMTMGRFAYAGQYEQHPVPLGGGQFDITKINFGKAPPDSEFTRIYRYWDKAGTKDAGARTAGVKLGIHAKSGRIWILHCEKGQWAAYEREKTIDRIAMLDGKKVKIATEQEPGSGGKESAENTASRLARKGFICILDKPSGDKFIRAEPFAYAVGNGIVWMPDNAEWVKEYLDEMKFFGPQGKYKDQIDASSGAFALATQQIIRVGAVR